MEKLKVASLFCGCGGTDVGLLGDFEFLGNHYASNDLEIVYANDIDDNACNIFKENFGIEPDNRDIREVTSDEIPEFDILTGVRGGFLVQKTWKNIVGCHDRPV